MQQERWNYRVISFDRSFIAVSVLFIIRTASLFDRRAAQADKPEQSPIVLLS